MLRTKLKTTKMAVTAALLAGGMMAGFGANAQASTILSGTMCMLPTTSCAGSGLTGTIDYTDGGTMTLGANTFSGLPWTVHNSSVEMTAGNYSITDGTNTLNYTVGAGQIGAQMLMDWGPSIYTNMLVAFVWNYSDSGGVRTLTPGATGAGTANGGVIMINGFAGQVPGINMTTDLPAAVPIPAAAWLFGSGLLGLVGVARRKKANA